MSSVTVSLNSMWPAFPERVGSLGLSVGLIIRVKRQRRMKDKFLMISKITTSGNSQTCTMVRPNYYKKKNGYTVDRLRNIYKHKPKKAYF